MLPVLAFALSLPAQAAWSDLGSKHDCVFSKQEEGEVTALRALCTWNLPVDKVSAVVANWAVHDDVFGTVASSELVGALSGGKGRVHQVHEVSGMTDREIFMDVSMSPIDGGTRYTHAKAANQAGLDPERVEVGRDDGLWEVKATADGGCTVLYELRYDPAGSVPGFLIKWFQGSGFKDMMGELRDYVQAH